MTRTKVTTKRPAQDKAGAADFENLAMLLAGVRAHPATPAALRQHRRYGLSEVFDNLPDNDRVTDSPEHITQLSIRHAEQTEGGAS